MAKILQFRPRTGEPCVLCGVPKSFPHESLEDCVVDLSAEVKAMGKALRLLLDGEKVF